MLELIQITNDPAFAQRCDALEGIRVFVDLERLGKAERQAGRNTFISVHRMEDVGRIRAVVRRARLMVRINPLHAGTASELDAVLAQGPDLVMLPMFTTPAQLREFTRLVAGRVPVVALLETAGALQSLEDWVDTSGLQEVYVGLNDLHLSLGLRFMFEPLASGIVDRVAGAAKKAGRRFGFGGIARLDEGLLPGSDVLAEHLRLGSGSVILSRTFNRPDADTVFEQEIAGLRRAEEALARRDARQVQEDSLRIRGRIEGIAAQLAARA
jgi:hypothetical protein